MGQERDTLVRAPTCTRDEAIVFDFRRAPIVPLMTPLRASDGAICSKGFRTLPGTFSGS
jgi:hypothetical protein